MNLKKIQDLDEMRQTIRLLQSSLNGLQRATAKLYEKAEQAYFEACDKFNEDGECNCYADAKIKQIETIPLSMKMKIPDAPYAWECGDECAQQRKAKK